MGPLLAALALQVTPAASWAQTLEADMSAWKLCVLATAKDWSRQNAAPSDIAEGAIGHCAQLLRKTEITMRSGDYLPSDDVDRLVTRLKSTWRERAIAAVLEERAKPVRKMRTK